MTYPRTTVIREGIDTGKVAVEFGPRGPIFYLAADGTVEAHERAPVRGDGSPRPLRHGSGDLRRFGTSVRVTEQ